MKIIVHKWIKLFISLMLLVIILFNLTGCYDATGIEELAYAIAIGLDISDDNQLELTMQFASAEGDSSDSSSGSSSQSSKSTITSVKCNSIDSGIALINSHISKKVNLSHCQEIIISKKLAYMGLSEYLDTFSNNIELKTNCSIIISENNAKDYLEHVDPSLETLTARYYEYSLNSSQYTAYTVKVNLSEFYSEVKSSYSQAYAILAGINSSSSSSGDNSADNSSSDESSYNSNSSDTSSSDEDSSNRNSSDTIASTANSTNSNSSNEDSASKINANYIAGQTPVEDKDPIEALGIAVFNGDKLVGELTGLDSMCHVIVNNELDECTLSVPSPFEDGKYVDISLTSSTNTKCSVNLNGSSPNINIDVYLIGYGLSLNDTIDYSTEESLSSIQTSAESYLENQIKTYLYKTSKDYNSDISGFGRYAVKNYLTTQEWNESNWLENYKNSSFNVNVNLTMKAGSMFSSS